MPKRKSRKARRSAQFAPSKPGRRDSGVAATPELHLTRRRLWMFRIAAVLFIPLLLWSGVEILLRVIGYGYPTSFLVRTTRGEAYTINEKFSRQFYARDVPGSKSFPLFLPVQKPAGTMRIFVLGESAAMGTPNPAFGFARILEVMLRSQSPDQHFEIVNAAMRGINSHIIRMIARDCAHHEPDLFIVYMGNNEIAGLHAPGPESGILDRNLVLIRAVQWLKRTKIAQLITALMQSERDHPNAEEDMDFFRRHRMLKDDPRRQPVYENFRANLEDICQRATEAGAKVLLCTVPVNLKDFPPLGSLHRANVGAADQTRWQAAFDRAIASEAKGDLEQAVRQYEEAVGMDDHFAELHFRMARCEFVLGQFERARRHFGLARDWDALQFRADSQINEIIRTVAARHRDHGVTLLDCEGALAKSGQVDHELPGNNIFLDQVHPRFSGDYLLASALFGPVTSALSGTLNRRNPANSPLPTINECARQLAFTSWDQLQIDLAINGMMSQPPFLDQLDHAQRQLQTNERLKARAAAFDKTEFERVLQEYHRAIAERPDDWELHHNLGLFFFQIGDYPSAVTEMEVEVKKFPDLASCRVPLSSALARSGRIQEAIAQLEAALQIDPSYAPAKNGLEAIRRMAGYREG